MADRKKQSPMEQIVSVLRDLITEPVTDQSSLAPTAADVRRVKAELRTPAPRKKKPKKARAKPVSRKKTTRTKRSKKG